ncbi:tetratricopeptide repeat protein [Psychromonas sp. KJ10-2]|uniref:tetratricopeptide repeat protein n=1 Tax=Psychromonas sp. KJ10-2 TaxID=3391822 RepID=UPI0039B60A46
MKHHKIAIVCLSSFLWACSTKPTVTAPVTDPITPNSSSTTTDSNDNNVKRRSALNSLLNLAEQQESQGNLQGATRTLERAIRISPRNPEIYLQLAELNYRQGRNAQAESFAEKALSFNPNDTITEKAELLLKNLETK